MVSSGACRVCVRQRSLCQDRALVAPLVRQCGDGKTCWCGCHTASTQDTTSRRPTIRRPIASTQVNNKHNSGSRETVSGGIIQTDCEFDKCFGAGALVAPANLDTTAASFLKPLWPSRSPNHPIVIGLVMVAVGVITARCQMSTKKNKCKTFA